MDLYGPPLPPGYVRPEEDDDSSNSSSKSESESTGKAIGPQRPNFLSETIKESESMSQEHEVSVNNSFIGPEIPSHLLKNNSHAAKTEKETYGPELTEFQEDADDLDEKRAQIEKRAKQMRDKLDNKNVPVEVCEREEWMTVPDTSRRNQLGAISRCLAPSSKSSSKDKHSRSHRHSEKDKMTSEELKKYNKSRRSESLMDIHSKKLKKKEKEKKSKDKAERKAFDREEMAVRHFTKDQVNSVVDKAKFLNSRFKAGSSQYL